MSRMAVRVGPPVTGTEQASGTDNSLVLPRIITFAKDVSPCLVHAKVSNATNIIVKINKVQLYNLNSYTWTQGTTDTDEWYLSRNIGKALVDPNISAAPALFYTAGVSRTKGTLGSLTSNQWGYGDNDSLGYSTIYFFGDPGTVVVMTADDFDGDTDDDGVGHFAIPKLEHRDVSLDSRIKIQSVSFVTLHASDDLDLVSVVGWEA